MDIPGRVGTEYPRTRHARKNVFVMSFRDRNTRIDTKSGYFTRPKADLSTEKARTYSLSKKYFSLYVKCHRQSILLMFKIDIKYEIRES